ncbi:MAG: HD domain-containing protein [Candidatus Nealsonbacteria bacterium]
MRNTLDFLINVGKLKKMERRGWVLRGIKNPETIAAHTFRMTLMAWVLCCKKKLSLNKILKMSLIHDLCEVCAGDTTPYDHMLPKDKKKWKPLFKNWRRLSKKEKERLFKNKHKKEKAGLNKLISGLPASLKGEIKDLWDDYEEGLSAEGRFVRQLDRIENLLQALEYRKEGKKIFINPWWVQIEELIDDPLLIEFMRTLESKFYKKGRK